MPSQLFQLWKILDQECFGQIVLNTWGFGAKANQVAWDTLLSTGSPLDAVEKGCNVCELKKNPTVSATVESALNITSEKHFEMEETTKIAALRYFPSTGVKRLQIESTPINFEEQTLVFGCITILRPRNNQHCV